MVYNQLTIFHKPSIVFTKLKNVYVEYDNLDSFHILMRTVKSDELCIIKMCWF